MLLLQHRSIRKYKKDPVEEDKLQRILTAATRASSSGNMQAYSIIVTSDADIKEALYKPHFEQSMVIEAPLLLTFCADFHRMREWLKISDAPMNFDNFMSFMIASIDAILASQNAALAAEAEGLGICYMGTTLASCAEIGEILGCPKNVVPVVGFSLGYPDESPVLRDRLPLESIVHRERYNDFSETRLKDSYREKEIAGMKRYLSDPELAKRVTESGVENLAQLYTIMKYTRESHLQYSQTVLSYLEQQGFMENI
ncbi:nitroreductase family protein [Bdellovibrio sp. NC01]|uniref:nitroreductase family protein n=1 Tax=Bdellovibrio sp. NC01 TaxID=2220073 RepID=UPI00352E3BF7